MNKWKIAFWICLLLLIGTALVGLHSIIDQGVTLAYLRDAHTDTESDLNTLIELINKTDLSKSEIQGVLKTHRLYEYMDFEKDSISIERVMLYFKNEKLDHIKEYW